MPMAHHRDRMLIQLAFYRDQNLGHKSIRSGGHADPWPTASLATGRRPSESGSQAVAQVYRLGSSDGYPAPIRFTWLD